MCIIRVLQGDSYSFLFISVHIKYMGNNNKTRTNIAFVRVFICIDFDENIRNINVLRTGYDDFMSFISRFAYYVRITHVLQNRLKCSCATASYKIAVAIARRYPLVMYAIALSRAVSIFQ